MAGIRRKPGVENIHSVGGDQVAQLAGAWVRGLMVPRGGPRGVVAGECGSDGADLFATLDFGDVIPALL
jgi:hypothetical protein